MHRRRHIQAALVRGGAYGGIACHAPLHGTLKIGSKIDLCARRAHALRVMGHHGTLRIDHIQTIHAETQACRLQLCHGRRRIGRQQALHQFLDHGLGQPEQGDSTHHRPLGGLLHQRVGRTHQPLQAQHMALMQALLQQPLQTRQGSAQRQRQHHQNPSAPRRSWQPGLLHHHGHLHAVAVAAPLKSVSCAAAGWTALSFSVLEGHRTAWRCSTR